MTGTGRTTSSSPGWPGRCGPAGGWRSAFNAYFAVRYHHDATFDAARGVSHERTEVRDRGGEVAEVDLWTGCYTPREPACCSASTGSPLSGSAASNPVPTAMSRRPRSRRSTSSSPAGADRAATVPHLRHAGRECRPRKSGTFRRSTLAEAERVADGVGVDAERPLGVEEPGAEADGAVVGGVEVGDLEVDVQLLLDVGLRPRRGDEVGGPLEREVPPPPGATRLIHSSSPASGVGGQSSRRA